MAWGQHWEWRGFGEIEPALRERIEALPTGEREPSVLVDRYLWAPGCRVNVKFRLGGLKFKRLVDTGGGFECWLEDPTEFFLPPFAAETVLRVEQALGVVTAPPPAAMVDLDSLLARLARVRPPVRMIEVEKRRWLRSKPIPGFANAALVELAEIVRPEPLVSVALEHLQADAVFRLWCDLGLMATALRPRNYLEILEIWARGGSALD